MALPKTGGKLSNVNNRSHFLVGDCHIKVSYLCGQRGRCLFLWYVQRPLYYFYLPNQSPAVRFLFAFPNKDDATSGAPVPALGSYQKGLCQTHKRYYTFKLVTKAKEEPALPPAFPQTETDFLVLCRVVSVVVTLAMVTSPVRR